jgi:hypothetical protein
VKWAPARYTCGGKLSFENRPDTPRIVFYNSRRWLMSGGWLPVLLGGLGGGVLTNVWAEWRQSRGNRREDQQRFHADRLAAASKLLQYADEALRIQVRLAALRLKMGTVEKNVSAITDQYDEVVREFAGEAARFRLLFRQDERNLLEELISALDGLRNAVNCMSGVPDALDRYRLALEDLSEACRDFLNAQT